MLEQSFFGAVFVEYVFISTLSVFDNFMAGGVFYVRVRIA